MPEPTVGQVVVDAANYQADFQQRWSHLRHPDVRNLAWLLDSPVLLNAQHPRWANQLVQVPAIDAACTQWLTELDMAPQPLLDHLALRPNTRLGHYAEHLLAWYFAWNGTLQAHSVQVRSHITIGEFDFLLNLANGLEHWEFACKFYLLVPPGNSLSNLVGPNLADNLEDKSHKILTSQLALGRHAQSGNYLPSPLQAAKALLKGWLFYAPGHWTTQTTLPELNTSHCRGLWCRVSELDAVIGHSLDPARYAVLTRLRWLAPARMSGATTLTLEQIVDDLRDHFNGDARPVLIVCLTQYGDEWIERERIFVVPDDWNAPNAVHSVESANSTIAVNAAG